MSQEIIKVLDNLAQKFGVAIDWTSQNILPYLQDLMSRYISLQNAYAVTWIVISAIILIISFIIMFKSINKIKKDSKQIKFYDVLDDSPSAFFGIICSSLFILIFSVVILCNIFGLFQNIFTPEITILNYLRSINLGG